MTADPKAPGADAVYLEIREIDNDPMHFQTFYARVKVLTEKGKELATVNALFLRGNPGATTRIQEIHARTIHPDGTVIPLNIKPDDLLIEKSGDTQYKRKVFTLPDVQVGSILEYSYDLTYHDTTFTSPHWEIQRPYFIHKAHFQFTPLQTFMPRGTVLKAQTEDDGVILDERGRVVHDMESHGLLPEGVALQSSVNGEYSLDVADVPPIPNEDWTPPVDAFRYRLFFYYLAAHGTTDFWQCQGREWSKTVDKFASPSGVIKAAVNGLIAPTDSDLDKAKKLYAAVQALDNTDFSREKTQSERHQLRLKAEKRAEDTLTQKSGDSEDIALLYLAMLRAAGLTAYAVKVVDRERGIFDPGFLDMDELDSTLVVLSARGQQVLLDPGEKMCPFATVSWRHSFAAGLGQSAQGPSFTITPEQQYADNIVRRTGVLVLDGKGGVTGQLQIAMTGQEALRWRQTALENDEAEVKKQFDNELQAIVPEGVHAHVDHFQAIDDPNANLVAFVNIDGTLGMATARRLVVPSFFFETRGPMPFVYYEAKRVEPVDMHYPVRVTDQITYRFPSGFIVEGAPQDTSIDWPGQALFVAKSLTQAAQITTAQTLTRAFTIAKPDEYPDLRSFFQKVAAADQQQIVLESASAIAGKAN